MRRAALILLIATTVVAACGDDDDDDDDDSAETAVSTSAAPATTPPTTLASSDTTEAPEGTEKVEHSCVYRERLLVTTESIQDLIPELNEKFKDEPEPEPEPGTEPEPEPEPEVIEITDYFQLTDIGGVTPEDDVATPTFTEDDFAALTGIDGTQERWLYDVTDNDPLAVAQTVDDLSEIDASPVLGMTLTGHWTLAPGSAPTDGQPTPSSIAPFESAGSASIAVVDSGYTESDTSPTTPPWLADRVEVAGGDVDEDSAQGLVEGHGKFVASVIVQQAPQTFVRVAAMNPVTPDHFYALDSDVTAAASEGYLADELQFLSAIERLIHPNGEVVDDLGYDALNLSLGAWACEGITRSALVLSRGLDNWKAATKDAPVVAAAGNHGAPPPGGALFLPGQDPTMADHGVTSLDISGTRVSTFSNLAAYGAIGECLLGIRKDGEGAYWSGTSFATAVVAASIAASNTTTTTTPSTGGVATTTAPTGGGTQLPPCAVPPSSEGSTNTTQPIGGTTESSTPTSLPTNIVDLSDALEEGRQQQ